jgi:hypothetical protein
MLGIVGGMTFALMSTDSVFISREKVGHESEAIWVI